MTRCAGWVLGFSLWAVSAGAQQSFIVTLTQRTEPPNVFTTVSVVTNYVPGSPVIVVRGMAAPVEVVGLRFTHWTLDGVRVEDFTGQASNPADVVLTNNVDAVAHYLPTGQDSDMDGLPDWYEIQYFNSMSYSGASDPDGDGIDVMTEKARGYHPRLADLIMEDGVSRRRSATTLVITDTNYVRVAQSSDPSGLFNQVDVVRRGTNFALRSIESLGWPGYGFTGWYADGDRLDDPRGFSKGMLSVTISNDIQFVARYLPSGQDADGDGLPDWFEQRHFNSLANAAGDDVDGDGLSIAIEMARGYSPNAPDLILEDGVSRRRSATTLVITDTNYVRVVKSSDPSGLFDQVDVVRRGTNFALRSIESLGWPGYGFTGWYADGDRLDDPRGFSKGMLSVTISNDIQFVARYLPSGQDADGDGLPDWFEQRHFNSLANAAGDDVDGDGLSIAIEMARGYSPNAPDLIMEDGVSRRRGVTLGYKPAPPVITASPASWSGPAGNAITLDVAPRGAPPWNYRWLLNGVVIPGATNETLILSDLHPTNSGLYSVVVANLYGATWSRAAEVVVDCPPLFMADQFEDAVEVTGVTGLGCSSNTNATRQANEPSAFEPDGTNSVWVAWRAPEAGIVTFQTRGSAFDTLMAVYVSGGAPVTIDNLVLVARDDDRGGFLNSRVQFNAVSNTVYYVAVDGYGGDRGGIVLSWDLQVTGSRLPVINNNRQPQNWVGPFGGTNELSVFAVSDSPMTYQWYRGGLPILAATQPTLTLTNIGLADVGNYFVRISNAGGFVDSDTVFLQINAISGDTNAVFEEVAALEKLTETVALKPIRAASSGGSFGFNSGPARGFSGAQYYTTAGNNRDDGIAWFKIEPVVKGRLLVTTEGSQFPTYFRVYSGASNAFNESSLTTQNFTYNKGSNYLSRRIEFDALTNTTYFIQLDSGSQRGLVRLSWAQDFKPAIGMLTQTSLLSASFELQLTNITVRRVQWIFNEVAITNQTNLFFAHTPSSETNSGDYSVEITDAAGRTFRDKFYLQIQPLLLEVPRAGEAGTILYFGPTGGREVHVEFSMNLRDWVRIATNVSNSATNVINIGGGSSGQRFYRLKPKSP